MPAAANPRKPAKAPTRNTRSARAATAAAAKDQPVPRELYTIAETCRALHVSHMTIHERIKAGELPVVRIGRVVRIRHTDIEAFIEAHLDGAGAPPRQRKARKAS
jgi:excisionase family DNA binding protein